MLGTSLAISGTSSDMHDFGDSCQCTAGSNLENVLYTGRRKARKKEWKNKKDFLGCAPIYEVIDSSDVPSSKAPAPPRPPIPSLRAFCTSFQTKLQSIQVGSISKYSRWIIHGSYEFQIKYLLTLYLIWKESIYFTLLSVKLPRRIHQQYAVPAATGEHRLYKLPHKSSQYKDI